MDCSRTSANVRERPRPFCPDFHADLGLLRFVMRVVVAAGSEAQALPIRWRDNMVQESAPVKSSIRALLISLLALFAFGCSSEKGETESLGRNSEVLTFPVTITLSTPAPVAPTAPVIVGSNS